MKKTKQTLRTFFLFHPVVCWAIISAIFAIIIHVAFSTPAISRFFVAKWGAGELLAYSSTVAIGLLAFWQNRRFKQENDAAQEQLKELSAQANTLTIVNRIIEIENENLNRLQSALESFSSACDPIQISTNYADSLSKNNISLSATSAMASQEKSIDDSFLDVARELHFDLAKIDKSEDPFEKATYDYYKGAKRLVQIHRDDPRAVVGKEADNISKLKQQYIRKREELLRHRMEMLNLTIYGNLSLDKIKEMYHKEYSIKEGANSGKTENAQPE